MQIYTHQPLRNILLNLSQNFKLALYLRWCQLEYSLLYWKHIYITGKTNYLLHSTPTFACLPTLRSFTDCVFIWIMMSRPYFFQVIIILETKKGDFLSKFFSLKISWSFLSPAHFLNNLHDRELEKTWIKDRAINFNHTQWIKKYFMSPIHSSIRPISSRNILWCFEYWTGVLNQSKLKNLSNRPIYWDVEQMDDFNINISIN